MVLEDIPEMHIVDDFDTDFLADVISGKRRFSGKFVVVLGPNSKPYFFALDRSFSHEQVAKRFSERAEKKYGVNPQGFRPLNGGALKIDQTDIYVYEGSIQFGKYDEAVVRPIVERFRQQHLPGHRTDFE